LLAIDIAICCSCINTGNKGNLEYNEPTFEKEINTGVKVLNDSFLFNYGCLKVVDSLIVYSGITEPQNRKNMEITLHGVQ